MDIQDLIKKLEKTELPKIEVPSHKNKLKMALLDYRKRPIFDFRRILIPAASLTAILLVAMAAFTIVLPQYISAKAREIAMKDPQIHQWISEGAEIKDVQLVKNKAYVLVSPREISNKDFAGAIAEVTFREDKVSNIDEVLPKIVPLSSPEIEKAEQIIKNSETQREVEIEELEPVPLPPSQLKFDRKTNKIEALAPEQTNKRVNIIYRVNGNKKQGQVDIEAGTIQGVQIIEGDEMQPF